jgi:hypothetical protein
MTKMVIEMPEVAMCAVTKCAYNIEDACCAHAITIGDKENPRCDTYLGGKKHVSSPGSLPAGVGACKVDVCFHNKDFECMADCIQVDHASHSADCITFKRR